MGGIRPCSYYYSTCVVVIVLLGLGRGEGYKNYTVGDNLGWYDTLQNPKIDYQKWAANKNFSLGDFLIFNTDNNRSVVQTYNVTTYKLCDSNDAPDNDTVEWSSADPSSTAPHPVTVPVPLTKVGTTYFFSSDYDGEQCQNGQRLMINVTRGQGLPPSLNDAPGPVAQQSGDDAAPDTIVPANFDHPKDISDDNNDDAHASSNSQVSLPSFGVGLYLLIVMVGFVFNY